MLLKNVFFRFVKKLNPLNNPKKIAGQLRNPNGKLGNLVARKMNESNALLYDLTYKMMNVSEGESVLEIGCGNGNFFQKLLGKADELNLYGLDSSELMVQTAREFNESIINDGKLEIIHSTSSAIPFESNFFDKIFCINVVYFWESAEENLFEILRVLKPGGKFYASIRLKESMEIFPFTKHGFKMYDHLSWKKELLNHHFEEIEYELLTEKGLEFNGLKYDLKSACISGTKPF
ncbi:MAG: class I SAM-dependent methyltransferase [Flavobacteriales bacterium]|nr:class I SAM-dependent methyltransferase [Flavobacteriales bacterium]